MESFEVFKVSKFAEYVTTYYGCYGHVREERGGFGFGNMKFLLAVFDLEVKREDPEIFGLVG